MFDVFLVHVTYISDENGLAFPFMFFEPGSYPTEPNNMTNSEFQTLVNQMKSLETQFRNSEARKEAQIRELSTVLEQKDTEIKQLAKEISKKEGTIKTLTAEKEVIQQQLTNVLERAKDKAPKGSREAEADAYTHVISRILVTLQQTHKPELTHMMSQFLNDVARFTTVFQHIHNGLSVVVQSMQHIEGVSNMYGVNPTPEVIKESMKEAMKKNEHRGLVQQQQQPMRNQVSNKHDMAHDQNMSDVASMVLNTDEALYFMLNNGQVEDYSIDPTQM